MRPVLQEIWSRGSVKDPILSSCSRCVCVTTLMGRCWKALRLVGKLKDETACEKSSGSRDVLDVTHLSEAVLSSADEHYVLLYIEATAAHPKAQEQIVIFNGRVVYSYAALLLQKRRPRHSTACKRHPFSIGSFLLTKFLQKKASALSVEKMYLNTNSLFFHEPAD